MKICQLFIDNSCQRDDEIEHIISRLKIEPVWVNNSQPVYDHVNKSYDPVLKAKQTLFITQNTGAVIKECPGTSFYTCCDYTILHTGTFCNMDCSYCILQAYFHPPLLQYFTGLETISQNLDQIFTKKKIFRIGTGEYTDSLIWEKISLQPKFLVEKFAEQNHTVLELKTKSVNIESLLDLDHNGKTIIAWSLNTPDIIDSEEKGTASLISRLKAAKKVKTKGYKLAFHFDPMVIYPGCQDGYNKVIHQIFEYISPADIVWISMGSFRFMPKLKQIIEKRFKDSTICYGEFIHGLDNKMRYFKPVRIKLYKAIIKIIKEYSPDILVYFCMEDEEVWEKSIGFFPKKKGQLGNYLDKSAVKHCGLNAFFL